MYTDQPAQRSYTFLHTGDRQVKERFLFRWQCWQISTGGCQGIICQTVCLWLVYFRAIEGDLLGTEGDLVSLEDDDLTHAQAVIE